MHPRTTFSLEFPIREAPGCPCNPSIHVWPIELGLGTHNPRFVVWPLELGLGTHNPRFVAWPLELGLGTHNPAPKHHCCPEGIPKRSDSPTPPGSDGYGAPSLPAAAEGGAGGGDTPSADRHSHTWELS